MLEDQSRIRGVVRAVIAVGVWCASLSVAWAGGGADPGGYGLKIYKVSSDVYPFVQVYFRTFDHNQMPLVNLNERNIGLMVKGKSYAPMKLQHRIQSLRQRREATRSVLVIDASRSMAPKTGSPNDEPFATTLRAAARYVNSKRSQDEVAVIAIREPDRKDGFEIVSQFERDPAAIGRRLADIKPDGQNSRIYDSIAAAMQLCGTTGQGSIEPSAANIVVSCAIVVMSDGLDEGSALTREELNARITGLQIPIPVYSLAYSRVSDKFFKNLESISKNSFGIYYRIGETVDKMQQVVEQIQNILQSDYVVTFRAYQPVDGEQHTFKLGVEYPTGSGKFTYESAQFEALEPPPHPEVLKLIETLNKEIEAAPDGNPYMPKPGADAATGASPAAPQTSAPATDGAAEQ